jgi:hypothetical protein
LEQILKPFGRDRTDTLGAPVYEPTRGDKVAGLGLIAVAAILVWGAFESSISVPLLIRLLPGVVVGVVAFRRYFGLD